MKLSEAIMLGSFSSEQVSGLYVDSAGKRCALGAAMLAVGIQIEAEPMLHYWERATKAKWSLIYKFPYLNIIVEDPAGGPKDYLKDVIMRLNDRHCWSRQRIAQWVATIEARLSIDHTEDAPCCESHTLQTETPHAGVLGEAAMSHQLCR